MSELHGLEGEAASSAVHSDLARAPERPDCSEFTLRTSRMNSDIGRSPPVVPFAVDIVVRIAATTVQ
jgi:hypothetical protein